MAITVEWRRRIDYWRDELLNHFYQPLKTIEFSGFTTKEHLKWQDAHKGTFRPTPIGTKWGTKWEYGWFKSEIVVPKEATGKRFVMRPRLGGEYLVFVNGDVSISRDKEFEPIPDNLKNIITLSKKAKPGQKYEILIESYAGHGRHVWVCGPTPPDRITVPEPPATQAEIGESSFGIWEEDAYQLWLDMHTLYDLRDNIDPDSLRTAEIDEALRDLTYIVDFELPYEERIKTFHAGRKHLRALLKCRNGSTMPTMFVCGHAHIDVAWLWPLAQSKRKIANTFGNQLALFDEYPEYKFLQSQAALYQITKELYPELYERVKKAVKAGNIVPEGGMWVESDTNIPSGESLIRQFMHGKRFFLNEFGYDCEFLWLPDVFGYTAALPQILHGCGIKYFSTAKLYWDDNEHLFPYSTFIWEGIDGSQIKTHFVPMGGYGGVTTPNWVIRRWKTRPQKDGISTLFWQFGQGDGGGGADRDNLEFALRLKNLEGVPKMRLSSPNDFFKDQESRGWPDAKYVGELYHCCHRGTYTSQARMKRLNRKSELALRDAEMWSAFAGSLKKFTVPYDSIDDSWKKVLLNQFHDILPGSSITRVYEEAESAYEEVIKTAENTSKDAISAFAKKEDALTVYNSLGWDRAVNVALPKGWKAAKDTLGAFYYTQEIQGNIYAEINVPSCGWITILPSEKPKGRMKYLKVTKHLLENSWMKIKLNDFGEIASIIDNETDRELTSGLCNSLKMYKDVPTCCDAWDIESMYKMTPVPLHEKAKIKILYSGQLEAAIQVNRKINNSDFEQKIILQRASRRIDFVTNVDWRERHKLLKAEFPVNIHANEAIHEIQFGHVKRPNHYSRHFDAERFEVSNHKWSALVEENRGVAILNDCKYGLNVFGNSINLTLLRAPLAPDMHADKRLHEFTYSFYYWNGSFADSNVVREAYELNIPVITAFGNGGINSLFSVDAPNIIIETIKPAEDRSGDVIVRLYESMRTTTRCTLETTLPVVEAFETDMIENTISEITCKNRQIKFNFRPFEIKTIRLSSVRDRVKRF